MTDREIYDAVTGIRDEYLEQSGEGARDRRTGRQKRLYALRTAAAFAVCAVAVTALAVHLIRPQERVSAPVAVSAEQTLPAGNVALGVFRAAARDPDADAYAQDELPLVRVTAGGITYDQIDTARLADFGIGPAVPENAFGERLGAVVELDGEHMPDRKPDVWSKEPSLRGAQVYLYAPAKSRAIILVRTGETCAVFASTGQPTDSDGACLPFADACRFFSPAGTDGIASIEYEVSAPAFGGTIAVTRSGAVTDAQTLAALTKLLCALTPEPPPADPRTPTPDWFNAGMDAYRADPDAFDAAWYRLTVRFTNGCRLEALEFIPFVGDGYFSGMAQLTPAQTAALTGLLAEK